LASGATLCDFKPQMNQPPATNFGTVDTENAHPIIDLAIDEIAIFTLEMPEAYSDATGITIHHRYGMSSAVANDIKLETSLELMDDAFDYSGDDFAAARDTGDITVPGTNTTLDYITSVHTKGAQMKSIVKNKMFRLKVTRVAVAGTDAAGDLEYHGGVIKET